MSTEQAQPDAICSQLTTLWTTVIASHAHALAATDHDVIINMEMSDPEEGVLNALKALCETLPDVAFPAVISFDPVKDKVPDLRLAGVPIRDIETIPAVVGDLIVIEAMMTPVKVADAELFAIGTPGNMNPQKRIAGVWAASPMESVHKFFATIAPGFTKAPEEILDLAFDPELEMRAVGDWRKVEILPVIDEVKIIIGNLDQPDHPVPE